MVSNAMMFGGRVINPINDNGDDTLGVAQFQAPASVQTVPVSVGAGFVNVPVNALPSNPQISFEDRNIMQQVTNAVSEPVVSNTGGVKVSNPFHPPLLPDFGGIKDIVKNATSVQLNEAGNPISVQTLPDVTVTAKPKKFVLWKLVVVCLGSLLSLLGGYKLIKKYL